MLKVLDLFSGIGGFSLGLERTGYFETSAFCEIDESCRNVLKKYWPYTPIYNDIRDLNYDGAVDVIAGGFPCQPFSLIGKRLQELDERNLWPEMLKKIIQHKPLWVIGENVNGAGDYIENVVLPDLNNAGYRAGYIPISGGECREATERQRLWIIAHHDSLTSETENTRTKPVKIKRNTWMGYSGQARLRFSKLDWKEHSPRIYRVDDGLSDRMDRTRMKMLGNSIYPAIAEVIGNAIINATYGE